MAEIQVRQGAQVEKCTGINDLLYPVPRQIESNQARASATVRAESHILNALDAILREVQVPQLCHPVEDVARDSRESVESDEELGEVRLEARDDVLV